MNCIRRRNVGAFGELFAQCLDGTSVRDPGDVLDVLQSGYERRGLSRCQSRCATQLDLVRDEDDALLEKQIPVDVKQVVGHVGAV
ncbi:unannotated protein [freshwater metagenome]|uniref:Unannotated protein n=1 Tax=freshwater metagenome TaxID=449393 RepID=A0A6J6CZB8_9ZZZZ